MSSTPTPPTTFTGSDRGWSRTWIVDREKRTVKAFTKIVPEDVAENLIKAFLYARKKNQPVKYRPIPQMFKDALINLMMAP